MTIQTKRAAQYIRMSTDRQDLSPLQQKDAIAAFARSHHIEIVHSYEDEGKSGVRIANRPGLRQLLQDVTNTPRFSEILVYDVSRWGRFQDADASAYYEYHCRLHGVQVIYVCEQFGNDQTSTSVLLKSMRRVMAAEYSRDIAMKARAGQKHVVEMGFQMGALPSLGYRRCSVSADGTRRVMLERGQRKIALTDRIEWVLGPEAEVAMVQRIGKAFASGFQLEEIAGLLHAEGWRTSRGRFMGTQSLKVLLTNEALIGNFVWGIKSKGGKVIKSSPNRQNGSVPRILDDAIWAQMQRRLKEAAELEALRQTAPAVTTHVPTEPRQPKQLALPLKRTEPRYAYRRTLGEPQQLRDHTRMIGKALRTQASSHAIPAAFDPRTNVLTFWNARVRVRLMWPVDSVTWRLDGSHSKSEASRVLVVRMTHLNAPLDYFLVPAGQLSPNRSLQFGSEVPSELQRYWLPSSEALIAALAAALSGEHDQSIQDPKRTGSGAPKRKHVGRGGKNKTQSSSGSPGTDCLMSGPAENLSTGVS